MLDPRELPKMFPLVGIRKAISIKVHQRSTLCKLDPLPKNVTLATISSSLGE